MLLLMVPYGKWQCFIILFFFLLTRKLPSLPESVLRKQEVNCTRNTLQESKRPSTTCLAEKMLVGIEFVIFIYKNYVSLTQSSLSAFQGLLYIYIWNDESIIYEVNKLHCICLIFYPEKKRDMKNKILPFIFNLIVRGFSILHLKYVKFE